MRVRSVPYKRGFLWYQEAWLVYKNKPLLWSLVAVAITSVPAFLGNFFSVPGTIFGSFIQSILTMGIYRIYRHWKVSKKFDFQLIISEFGNSEGCWSLIRMNLFVYFGIVIIIGFLGAVNFALGVTLKDLVSVAQLINSKSLYLVPDGFWKLLILNFTLLAFIILIFSAAATFTLPLLTNNKLSLFTSMKYSLLANFKNVGPFAMATLYCFALLVVVILTLGLGAFVLLPIMYLTYFLAYEDIFETDQVPIPTAGSTADTIAQS
jgi:hypothetical protein